jgi:hypothetical protein
MAREDLLLGFRTAEMAHHLGRIDAAQEVEVAFCPRLDLHVRSVRSVWQTSTSLQFEGQSTAS